MLPSVDGRPVGEHRMFAKLIRGIYRKRPPLPKMKCILEVNSVVWLNELGDNDSIRIYD